MLFYETVRDAFAVALVIRIREFDEPLVEIFGELGAMQIPKVNIL